MSHFCVTIDIQAPPERVIAVLRDVEKWPEWTPTVSSAQRLDQGPFRVGSKARVLQPKLRPATWEVTELDDRSFTWITRNPGLLTVAEHMAEPLEKGSRVTLALTFSGFLAPVIARIYRDLNQRYLATEAEGLRKRCEGETAPALIRGARG